MKNTFGVLVLVIAINITIVGQVTNPDRIISKDTTISAGIDSLNSNLIVNEDVTLTILPGVTLYFKQAICPGCSYKIIVKGKIIAKGTAVNPIIFTSKEIISSSGFMGISIEKPSSASDTIYFDNCIFEYSHWGSTGALSVNEFSKVKLTNCIIRKSDTYGIYNKGFVSVDKSSIYNNSGGIYNKGSLLVLNSTIYNNKSKDGQIGRNGLKGYCDCGFSIPSEPGSRGGDGTNGGGIYNDNIASIINSTIVRNSSGNYGLGGSGGPGGIRNLICLDFSTGRPREEICSFKAGSNGSNGSIGKGGGIYNTGIINLKNSIVAYNKRADNTFDDIFGTINTSKYNIVSNKSNISFTNDSIGNMFVNPLVDTLKFNGGITPTCALIQGSAAINGLRQGLTDIPVLDQRSFIRLDNPDIGSYEYGAVKYRKYIVETICKGNSFMGHTESGRYIYNLKTYDGWDSLVILDLTVKEVPSNPVITLNYGILQSNYASGNQWYFRNSIIQNANNNTYIPSELGDYYVIVKLDGCSSQPSNTILLTAISDNMDNNAILFYPNPTSSVIKILINEKFDTDYMVEVYDNVGGLKQAQKKGKSVTDFEIDLNKFSAGFYFIRIYSANRYFQTKLIKR